jgi:vitamin B12 transporter
MKFPPVRRCAGLLACLAPAWAWSQAASTATDPSANAAATANPITRFDPVVVTASRNAQPLSDTLGDVSVIDRDTLDRAGQSSLAELLSQTHGIQYATNGTPQNVTSLFVRGANSNQTLVLVDGQRINNASNGLAALNAIPPDSIQRVEVVRGAASSLYGADAIGGVINVITKPDPGKPFSAFANVGGGTYGTSNYNAGVSGASAGWTYGLAAGYAQSSGYDATTSKNFLHNPDKDSYYQNNVSANLGYEWKAGQTLSAQFYQTHLNTGYDNGAPFFNDRSVQMLQGYSLASTNRVNDFWTSTLRLGSTVDDNRSYNAPGDLLFGDTPDGRSDFRTRQNQLLWQNDLQIAAGQKLSLAYEYLQQQVSGDIANFSDVPVTFGDYTQTRRHVNSFTAVYLGDFGPNHVQASLRSDDNSQFGEHVTGGLSYGYDLTSHVRASVAANTGFRAPDFNELYWPNDGGFVGNPNLKPETSRNIEASLRYLDDVSEYGATVYRNRVHNLIVNQAADPGDPFSVFEPFNVSNALLEGVTLTAMHAFGNTHLRASVDVSDPHNQDTGEQLPQRAKRVLRLSADHRFGGLLLGAEYYLSSQRPDALTGDTLGGYGLVNLLASYDLTKQLQVQVRWNNVFNKDYTLVQGYRPPGSNAFVNLRWSM